MIKLLGLKTLIISSVLIGSFINLSSNNSLKIGSNFQDTTNVKVLYLLSNFNDSLIVKYGTIVLYDGFCLSDRSTGESNVYIPFKLDSENPNKKITICLKKSKYVYTISPNSKGKMIYVWKVFEKWQHEITDKLLEFE